MSAVVVEYLRFVHAQERRARVRAWLIAATPSSPRPRAEASSRPAKQDGIPRDAPSGSPVIRDSGRSRGYLSLVVSLRRARRALCKKTRQ